MTWNDANTFISSGGYAYRSAWPSNTCVAYAPGLMKFVGMQAGQQYTPSQADLDATDWGHSDQHTDKPPRKP